MMKVKELYEIRGPSSTSGPGTIMDYPGGELTLRFDYNRDGTFYRSGLRFFKVRATRQRAELHCTGDYINLAYDKLVEVQNSEWIEELLQSTPDDQRDFWKMNHYLIFFDGSGAYEIVAESWEELPEENGTWE